MTESLVTVSVAAKILDKSEWQVRDLERRGAIQCVRANGRMRLFSRETLEAYRGATERREIVHA